MYDSSTSRAELTAAFKALQGEFNSKKNDIKNKESDFDKQRENFTKQFNFRSKQLGNMIGHKNPLQLLTTDLTEQFKGIFDGWESQVAARSKGTKFREDFGDSLLVFIYGKVKSGKSSLGNYIAWGHSEPSVEIKKKSQQPTYFSAERTKVIGGDKEKEAENNSEFRVNATEATSSIQGFKLPGLTWVDSPGLHSVNIVNGDLAKEYVEHADLILYTMSSQAPGRASDMEEIKDLLNSNKKLMVLLTNSDTTDEDEDEDGNLITLTIMKDTSDRQSQVEYVHKELSKLSNSSNVLADILSVSTRYAECNPTPKGIAESGMGRLMHELETICTSDALTMKLNTPMDSLKKSITTTANDLVGTKEYIDGFSNSRIKQDNELKNELNTLGIQGASQMRDYINQVFNSDKDIDLEVQLRNKVAEIIESLSIAAFNKLGESQQQGLKQAFDSSRLSKLPEYQEITEEKSYFTGTKKGNKSFWGLGGSALGGGLGFLLGGPAGALIGSSLGSSASFAGRSASAEYGRHKLVVGDNREDQRQSAIEHYSNTLPDMLTDHVNSLYAPLRKAMQEYCEALESDIAALIGTLKKLSEVNK